MGGGAGQYVGQVLATDSTLAGRVIESGKPILATEPGIDADLALIATQVGFGPVIAVPLVADEQALGALCIARGAGRPPFTESDLDMVAGYATQAALALELSRARTDQQLLSRLEDHDRIARDLHDHVIQELFALGMGLQGMIAAVDRPKHAARLAGYVDSVDTTIKRIRTTIFQLQPNRHSSDSLQTRLLALIADEAETLGFTTGIQFAGPLDLALDEALAEDIIAVTREALSNCARHAHATSIDVSIALALGQVTVEVTDNGRGIGNPTRSSGLTNMRHRARTHHGTLQLATPDSGGTHLIWTAQLPGRDAGRPE
jgi:signal transduction histidine kinase